MNHTIRTCVAAALVAAVVVTACGGDDDAGVPAVLPTVGTEVPRVTDAPDAAPVASPADAAFPVTIAHKFGETVISEPPERIVVVGLTEQDALLALGVVPVATTEWFGEHPGAIWPWAQDRLAALGAEPPVVLNADDGLNYEQIASLHPDLILGLYAGLVDDEYTTLTQIAPTVAQPGEYVDWGVSWDEALLTIGDIVGERATAEALAAEVEALFTQAITDHPEFVGAAAAMATPYEGIWVYAPEDVRGRLLTSLGFEMPPSLSELATDEFGFDLSLEQADLLDVDVLVWLDAEEVGRDDFAGALYHSLAVHTEGRDVFLDSDDEDAFGGAASFVTVLSLPYLLDGIVPMLAAALDGDPATNAG